MWLQFNSKAILKLLVLLFTILFNSNISVNGQETWCGKNYRQGTPVIEPGGHHPVPSTTEDPLLSFSCEAAIKPYLENDDTLAGVLLNLEITHVISQRTSSVPSTIRLDSKFLIRVSSEGVPLLTAGVIGLGKNQLLTFPLFALQARKEPYELACTAQFIDESGSRIGDGSQPDGTPGKEAKEAIMDAAKTAESYNATAQLVYLPPNPYGGSVVKIDTLTKALLVKSEIENENGNEWRPIFPFGFYTSFGGYLAKNLSILDDMVNRGYNLVHPVPTFDNLTALDEVLDRMETLSLWLMYDMRWSYKNSSAVQEEVKRIQGRKNLLLWYTADEPDGWVDALDAPKRSYDQINNLDGYHPVSLVLNCQDYYFTNYSTGADILLQDTYPIGINAAWSTIYNTSCTDDYGDCGCDNCVDGSIEEISRRLDEFYRRLDWEGRNSVGLWSVGQAFGSESFWNRPPTGPEFVVQSIVSIIHGAKGIVSWVAPIPEDIQTYATMFAKALPTIGEFILNSTASFETPSPSATSIDVGSWTTQNGQLVMGSNLSNNTVSIALDVQSYQTLEKVLMIGAEGGIEDNSLRLHLDGLASFIVILR